MQGGWGLKCRGLLVNSSPSTTFACTPLYPSAPLLVEFGEDMTGSPVRTASHPVHSHCQHPMNQSLLETRLADLPLGGIRYFERIGSTNDEAAAWLKQGCPDLALVVADAQSAGRGRAGRKWFTPPGAGLAFSLVLRAGDATRQLLAQGNTARLNGLGALAVCQALQEQHSLPAQIKWPNDVIVNGRKLAGVLAEAHWLGSELSAVVLGIGINLAPHPCRRLIGIRSTRTPSLQPAWKPKPARR